MAVPRELLSVLVCPKCMGQLRGSTGGESLLCNRCQVHYPVRDDVPILIPEEAISAGQAAVEEEMGQMTSLKTVTIALVEGKNKGQEFKLPQGCCCAVGRSVDDLESTRVFDTSGVVGLDDSTKQLVLTYVSQQFQGGASPGQTNSDDIGSFRRLPDLALSDGATSRLHAMLFHGPSGVGVLDLVSKNGTFVNGVEVESKFLKAGDVVTIGGSKLKICQGES